MRFPNPNLLRFIRPRWLQRWCALNGVLTGGWASDPYDYAEFACHLCGHELIAPWELCPGCGANMTDDESPNLGTDGLTDRERTTLADEYDRDMRGDDGIDH